MSGKKEAKDNLKAAAIAGLVGVAALSVGATAIQQDDDPLLIGGAALIASEVVRRQKK